MSESSELAEAPGKISPAARRTVMASFLGSTFEWYDFGIYGTTSAIVFNQVFFPEMNGAVGTLLALTTVAIGYFTRPIGGIIFGHFGDRTGRKKLLVVTMLLMGIPTFAIGLIPSYASIGALAPILLLVCRLLQGVGLGGEYAGAALAAIESVPENRRGFFGAIPQLGNPVGGVLGSIFVLLATTLAGDEVYAAWLWRVPFLVSVVLLAYAMFVRLRLSESGDFTRMVKSGRVEKSPLKAVVTGHWRGLLLGLGARAADAISGNLAGAVVIAYVTTYLHMSNSISLLTTVIPSILAIPLMLWVGKVADLIGKKRMFVYGLVALALATFPMFALLDTKVFALMVLGVVIYRLCNSSQFAVQSSFLADMFPTEVRYTAVSLVYQTGAIIGGLTPPAALAILIASDGSPWPLAFATAGAVGVSVVCAIAIRPAARTAAPVPASV
ncbi:MFS transporter [Isoptericola sp. NPDC057653]|uniref:MFS transporter n=1 Tax=Isoptericola sp. NPDC057653 TaxID=3346195 RepID=UPI003692C6C5